MSGRSLPAAARLAALVILLGPAAGCGGGLAAIGSGVAGAALPAARGTPDEPVQEGQITGRVTEVDELQRRIVLSTDDGRTGSVLYDSATLVVHGQEHHPITFIAPGDHVVVRTRRQGSSPLQAVRIDVHRGSGAETRDEPQTPPSPPPPPPPPSL